MPAKPLSDRLSAAQRHLGTANRLVEEIGAVLAAVGGRGPAAAGGRAQSARRADPIPRGGASTVAVLQALLAEDPAAAFARADIDGSGDLTLDEWERAFGAEEGVDAGALRALFHDFDADQDGHVSLAEFQAGLQAARPSAGGLDVLRGFVRNLELEGLLASRLAVLLQARRPADEKELPLDAAAIATHWRPGDAIAAWQDEGLEDEVARALEAQVSRLQRQLEQLSLIHI